MENIQKEEVYRVSSQVELAETGGGHNQKGIDFQRAWALVRMFELEAQGETDFLFLFETIQDVAILNSSTTPTDIKIYQVKKKDRGDWKWKDLTSLLEPSNSRSSKQDYSIIRKSPIGKLYSSVLAFKALKSTGRFVSNNGCDLPLKNGTNAATSLPCDLSSLDREHLNLLSKGLKSLQNSDDDQTHPALLHIEKIPIHPDSPSTYLRGVALSFLAKRSPSHAGQANALVDALLAKVGPLGAKTDTCSNFDDLQKERGYSRSEFISALGTLEQVPNQVAIIDMWLTKLSAEGGADFMQLAAIRVAASKQIQLQVMGSEDPQSQKLISDIDAWLSQNKPDLLIKDFIEKAKSEISDSNSPYRTSVFIAHLLLRAANKCVDQI